jgi:ATP-binding cassette subfamily B protein
VAVARGAALACDGVSFHYQEGHPVLDRFTLELERGERVAIVASSGGGKSTLACLLVRFHDPQTGRILLDGVDLRAYPRSRLRRAVRVVEQKPFLFSGTLLDNIRYGSWDAPREAVDEAIRLTGLIAWVASDPRGLDAPLGEAGRDLSGGQRQRVALARAILSQPALLVLDEATSALDSEAEGQILGDLEAWLARRTVVVLAHRLSTIRRVSRVVVLQEGRVADSGTLAELCGRSGHFRALFAEQLAAAEGGPP